MSFEKWLTKKQYSENALMSSKGTIRFDGTKWVVRASRMIGGGPVDQVSDMAKEFAREVEELSHLAQPEGLVDEVELEAPRNAIVASTRIRVKSMQEVDAIIERFKTAGFTYR